MSASESTELNPSDERMPNEPEQTGSAQEAQHWIELYRRVVEFEETILAQMRDIRSGLPAEAQEETRRSNIEPMEQLIATYRDRMRRLEQDVSGMAGDRTATDPTLDA